MATTEAVLDDKDAQEYLEKLVDKARNLTEQSEIVGLISAVTFQDIMDHFKKQQGPTGAWPRWSRGHRKRAAKLGFSEASNMLKWSGKLRQSVTPNARVVQEGLMWFNPAKTSGKGYKKQTQPQKASKKNKVKLKKRRASSAKPFPYAWWHDSVDDNPKPRPFMWLSKTALDKIAEIVTTKVLED
jgi:hypothetical protein